MDADLLLTWMSETDTGSIRELREHAAWLARAARQSSGRRATGRWVRDIAGLAHAEVHWEDDRWAIAPPVLTRLPDADGTAVLAGSRRVGVLQALQEELAVTVVRPSPAAGDLPTPATVLVQFDSVDQLQSAAQAVGVAYAGCAATRLGAVLQEPRLGELAAPPRHSENTLERLEVGADLPFVSATGGEGDGLYRLRRHGRRIHLYRSQDDWWHCELAAGVFLELSRQRQSVMRWRAEAGPGRRGVGTLFVDWGAPLPTLHARCLILCSGLPPVFSGSAMTASYVNVPAGIATAVADTLRQQLQRL